MPPLKDGAILIHLDRGDGTALCTGEKGVTRTDDVMASNCQACINIVVGQSRFPAPINTVRADPRTLAPYVSWNRAVIGNKDVDQSIISNDAIDVLVGAYGFTDIIDTDVLALFRNIQQRCSLRNVNLFCIMRDCRPLKEATVESITNMGVCLKTCPLPIINTSREDTSRFAEWMVDNVGEAPWFGISHFDMHFHGDFISYIRSIMPSADMIGDHHDGIMFMRRSTYQDCGVGFAGVDSIRVVSAGDDVKILPNDTPEVDTYRNCISLDVGELLAMRVQTLGMRKVWLTSSNGVGKNHLFTHKRMGSLIC